MPIQALSGISRTGAGTGLLPSGGAPGQVVVKTGSAEGDAAWASSAFVSDDIGVQGQIGFGIGVYGGDASALGLSPMVGTVVPGHDNYGNYQHANTSVVCCIPLFWTRIGSTSSPRYAAYGLNAIDIEPSRRFPSVAAANAEGFFLHRAFYDGGLIRSAFFCDKYIASPLEGSAVSVRNGVPISLTIDTGYTRSATLGGCSGVLADAVVLSTARGAGWQCESIFQSSALALLALAQAQAASPATCAWFDAAGVVNFPKGCNNALSDINDPVVTYATAGDPGSSLKPLTGSVSALERTTHNGQTCGVSDINGGLFEVLLGITAPGTALNDSTARSDGTVWTLKPSVAVATLTAGWGGSTDAWQPEASIGTLYEQQTDFFPWGGATGLMRYGNGSEQVFSGLTSGADWLRTCAGIPTPTGLSVAGSNVFGLDGCNRYNRANLVVVGGGAYSSGSQAGAFARTANYARSTNFSPLLGFRSCAYGAPSWLQAADWSTDGIPTIVSATDPALAGARAPYFWLQTDAATGLPVDFLVVT